MFHEILSQTMLKVSAFYLEKQKKVLFLKKDFLSNCQYQNKKALFTDPIFSEGFAQALEMKAILKRNPSK